MATTKIPTKLIKEKNLNYVTNWYMKYVSGIGKNIWRIPIHASQNNMDIIVIRKEVVANNISFSILLSTSVSVKYSSSILYIPWAIEPPLPLSISSMIFFRRSSWKVSVGKIGTCIMYHFTFFTERPLDDTSNRRWRIWTWFNIIVVPRRSKSRKIFNAVFAVNQRCSKLWSYGGRVYIYYIFTRNFKCISYRRYQFVSQNQDEWLRWKVFDAIFQARIF